VVSVLGLVMAFLLAPVGLVLSIVGLTRTAGGKRKGRGLAVAGIVVSVVMSLLLAVVAVALVSLGNFLADETGTTLEELAEGFPTADRCPPGTRSPPTRSPAWSRCPASRRRPPKPCCPWARPPSWTASASR
jgi:hypothetical protein